MGFRCIRCGKDFGHDKKALERHFQESAYCSVIKDLTLTGIDGIKKVKHTSSHKNYENISENHRWIKQNIISNDDGWDSVVCSRCGIKAKRHFSDFKFDMRSSMNKIENCTDDK